jgi:hypothetical protein
MIFDLTPQSEKPKDLTSARQPKDGARARRD